jgi:hypothetical protein
MQDILLQQFRLESSLASEQWYSHLLAGHVPSANFKASFLSDPHMMQDKFPHSDGLKDVFDDGSPFSVPKNSNAVQAVVICKARSLNSASPRVMSPTW